ncbi:hypothetical protein [Candidatus Enterococcus clewellii]|uniref:DUF5105 domain-containing protein n=1 Tax=Candidatus Enterococcus clewellii TaxID=1834193 RepID=A0A242K4Y1_9ENTE|nr:hypothetical protein [Enterococcus sp. 9E7_DIV0242]OTP14587.1 hypothetical protein A5888_002688 [Enterococcus sp. 9E7_DIV0242]
MKKSTLFFFSLLLLLISGCAQKENTIKRTDLADGDELLANSFERENGFSVYSLPELERSEAEEVVENDLELKLSGFVDQISELVEEHLVTEEQKKTEESCSISSMSGEASYIHSFAVKNKEELYPIAMSSQVKYVFNSNKKKAYFDRYKLKIDNSAITGKYNGTDLEGFVLALGKMINIPEEDILGELQVTLGKTKEELKNQQIVLYDTYDKAKEKKGLGKKIKLTYAENGILAKIQVFLQDYYQA